jgi:hypothetical protein
MVRILRVVSSIPTYAARRACVAVVAAGLIAVGVTCPAAAAFPETGPGGVQGSCSQSSATTHEEAAPYVAQLRQALRPTVARSGAQDPRIGDLIATPEQQVTFEVGKDGSTLAKARFAYAPAGSDSSFDVVLKGPISSSNEGTPLTDTGLTNGASVRVGYTLNLFTIAVPQSQQAFNGLSRLESYASCLQGSRPAQRAGLRGLRASATVTNSIYLNGSLEIAPQTFSFLNQDLTKAPSEKDTDYSANSAFGYSRIGADSNPLFFVGAGYSVARQHSAQSARQICTPVSGTTSTECKSEVVGPPDGERSQTLQVDLRTWSYSSLIAINPRFVRQRTVNTTGGVSISKTAEVAISYVVLKSGPGGSSVLDTNALTAGVRFGYQSGDTGTGPYFAVFFGTALGISQY